MPTTLERSKTSQRLEVVKSAVMRQPAVPAAYFSRYQRWNRIAGALLLLIVLPIIAIGVVLVWLTSRGSAIYRQKRIGRRGKEFTIYKIRSMRIDAEARTGAVWTTCSRDPRITPVGRFLRVTHLDELPQLWNVVRGEMALVGPRPERPEFTAHLSEAIPQYFDRLAVLPGITGLAQLNLPPDTDLSSVRRKLMLDLEYIERGSFLLDVGLIICTALTVLHLPRAWFQRLLRLERSPGTDFSDEAISSAISS
jgi:lipopolysaccharide/colanic/teichoic acid biosynthesis glycosyltransferase